MARTHRLRRLPSIKRPEKTCQEQSIVVYYPSGFLCFPYELHQVIRRSLCEYALRRTPVIETRGGKRVLETTRGGILDRLYPCDQWQSRRVYLCGKAWLQQAGVAWADRVREQGGRVLFQRKNWPFAVFIQ
jgi:hypothetical protein